MASKWNKELPHHGHSDFVFVVTGIAKTMNGSIDRMVMGVFSDYDFMEGAIDGWAKDGVALDIRWDSHDLRYPLAK